MAHKSLLTIFALTLILFGCTKKQVAQDPKPTQTMEIETYTDEDGDVNLIGEINEAALEKEPYSSWFSEKDTYEPNSETISQIKKYINDYDIEAFFGTWCGDSKREIPLFYKILEQTDFDMGHLHIYAVGSEGDLYKKTPNGDTDGKDISHVPTIIFYKDGKEVNRFVENSVGNTIEDDILSIVSGQDYKNYYAE